MSAMPFARRWAWCWLGTALTLSALAGLSGCSHKDEAPSAAGYYTGPMTKPTKMDAKPPKGGDQ
jgi:hypothetical protein